MEYERNRVKHYMATTGKKAGKYHYRYYKGDGEYMHIGVYERLLTTREEHSEFKKALQRQYHHSALLDYDEEYEDLFKRNKANIDAMKYSDPKWWKEESKKSMERINSKYNKKFERF